MFAQHHRWAIWNIQQHPYRHTASELTYINDAFPGVTNINDALNWVAAVLYPNAQPAVADVASLPTVGNTINDYRVVLDDGDGKQAAYRWEQREGDASPKWYKIYDMDWSNDSILAQLVDVTQDMYFYAPGKDNDDTTVTATLSENLAVNTSAALLADTAPLSWRTQEFIATDTGFVTTVRLRLFRDAGLTGNFRIKIQADDGAGEPDGIDLDSAVFPVAPLPTAAPGAFQDYAFSSTASITNGNDYHLVFEPLFTSSSGNNLRIEYDSSTTYPGVFRVSPNAGATWDPNFVTVDLTFQVLSGGGGPVAGLYAGQKVYGGATAGTNLTLNANSGDGTGAQSGYVQIDSPFRPTRDNLWDISTATERWKDGYFAGSLFVGTLTLAAASITDSSGTISFGDENLVTTGNITGAIVTGTSLVADDTVNQLTIAPGSITDTSGTISFGDENLTTTGTLTAAAGSQLADFTFNSGTILNSTGTISFDNENLITTGTLQAGTTTVTQLNVDNIRLDNNLISITNLNGNLELQANGTGVVDVQSPLTTLSQTVTGTVGITGQLNADNLRIDANTLSSTNLNGDIIFSPNGTGNVVVSSLVRPNADNTLDLGTSALKFRTGYFSTSLNDGVNDFLMSELMGLRSANYRDAGRTQAVQPGDALFWSGTQWLASVPDSEIDHGTLTGILDDDHTQYMLLAGRAGGQTLLGGINANDDLVLGSTANATKGLVLTQDDFAPVTDASFAAGWSGTDLGGPSNNFRDLYTKGELRGARMENFTSGTLPAASAQNTGRYVWATDVNKSYVDVGGSWQVLGVSKYLADTVWNGTDTTKDVNVSANITDARNAIWALHDNANDFERIYTNIRTISATTVRITVSPALPAGSYRLIGIE